MAELQGRLLVAEVAAGARMNKAKIVRIAAVALLTMLILTVAALSMARYDRTGDYFLWVCVVTHVSTICFLSSLAALAPTPAERRYFAECTVASTVHLAVNLYLVLVACPRNVQDGA